MNDIDRDVAGATRAHRGVIAAMRDLGDDQVPQATRLPDWTVGHVATHIARNADGHIRMLEAACRGEVAAMYPGGRQQRIDDIEAGARRTARELAVDVAGTAEALEATWATMPAEAWAGRGETIAGELPMTDLVFIRWREVAVHHSDLGLGYTWADWDGEYVRLDLVRLSMLWASRKPMGMANLPPQAVSVSPHQRVAWLLGRAEIEGLAPAGIIN